MPRQRRPQWVCTPRHSPVLHDFPFVEHASLPEELDEGIGRIALGGVSECVHCHPVSTGDV